MADWSTNTQDWADIQEHTIHPSWLAVLNELTPSPEELLLDLGCGAGGFTQLAARHDVKVSGLDASAALVEIARTRNPTGTFRVGDMEQLPFPDAEFAAVTAFNSLHFARNPARALTEAIRVTRPGGHIAISTWGPLIDCDALAYFLDLGGLLPSTPPQAEPPEDLSDPATARRLLSRTGLAITRERTLSCPWEYPDQATALRGLLSTGPAAAAISHVGKQRVTDTITESISPYRRTDGTYLLHNTCSTLIATRT
ncbi:class I SAM-dependent methyltransferase [Amycolatopsis sp. cmx-11-12]|uniref:class I SAM-dependent methyltransferase n=1 Tax=Amycolatopsis sp. cmx-11-12 TaxID=2785795 RepID=UPI003916DC46